jgi:transcription elongation GreA/GreB family factor
MDKVPITNKGYAALEEELKHRQQVERPRIIQAISEARALGDLSENAEYHAAVTSPIARALMGKKVGDTVEVSTPGGGKSYEVVGVRFG